jgi:hypothetical protein
MIVNLLDERGVGSGRRDYESVYEYKRGEGVLFYWSPDKEWIKGTVKAIKNLK